MAPPPPPRRQATSRRAGIPRHLVYPALPHSPHVHPGAALAACRPQPPDRSNPKRFATPGTAYYALITHLDDCIAHVLERLTGYQSPFAGQPLRVLFSSDHGEMLGDHHLFRKSLGYEASARVPFFFTGFNLPWQRDRCDDLVCWEDIAPTMLDFAGVKPPAWMDGRSLAPHARGGAGSASPRDHLHGEGGHGGREHHNLWIVTPRWKYLWFPGTGEEQLFDLVTDPRETRDLSADPALLAPLREHMRAAVAGREDLAYDPAQLRPCAGARPRVFWPDPNEP
jgi:arylsulfatase